MLAQAPFPLTYMSQNMRRYGYDANELLAKPNKWRELIESEDLPAMITSINLLVDGKADHIQIDFRLKKPDGSPVWFDGEGYALRNAAGQLTAIEGILTDVTDRKRKTEDIAALARTDSLTGLPNRAAFLERLNLEFARARRGGNQFAVHYIDLDRFKDVNDTLGHPIGDGFPPPALPGFSGTANLSATPGRPTCPSRASGWSSLTTPWGFPCCVRFPCVHAAANTPV